ncbi:MAG: hypothetical protein U0992_17830 [Planctomycetaceae bacterium]
MLKLVVCFAAAGLVSIAAVGATPELPPLPAPETAAVPTLATTPTPATPLVPTPDSNASPSKSAPPIVLYTNVKVEDRHNIPECAVPIVISIPDPCQPGCCRYIEICALPDCKPVVTTSPSGRKIEYDYGRFEVEIYNRSRYVVVNYDD